tara:strand:- start:139 stop:411 length:273 start_codon:yes stop_codon:yes gene_type:complete
MGEDEYQIRLILSRHLAYGDALFEDLVTQLDKTCGSYMDTREGIRKKAFTEMYCCLAQTLIKGEEETDIKILRKSLYKFLDSIKPLPEEK